MLTVTLPAPHTESGKRKKGSELEQIDCTPPEHILPGSKDRPLVPLQPHNREWKVSPTHCPSGPRVIGRIVAQAGRWSRQFFAEAVSPESGVVS